MLSVLLAVALAQTPRIDPTELARHVQFLASPSLEGRMTPSAGLVKAATYAAAEMKRIGLRPGPNPGYLWGYDVSINQRPGKGNRLELMRSDGRVTTFALGTQFVPLFGSKDNSPVSGELVFVGHGLEEQGWNDYEREMEVEGGEEVKRDVDVRGKIAVILADGPVGRTNPPRSAKAETARRRGAVGAIFVGPSGAGRAALPRTVRGQGLQADAQFVAVAVSESAVQPLIDVRSMRRVAGRNQSTGLPYVARIVTELEPNRSKVHNVVGYLAGRDPKLKDEFIVVGAHYDHLGYGEIGSRSQSDLIHAGADDNASGTASVLALAEHFVKAGSARSMIFQLYSGEEEGLLGSEAWCKAHPATLKGTAAMINLDMVGRLRKEELFVYGTSTWDGWDKLLAGVSVPGVQLKLGAQTRGDSDQASFARRNVPVLFFNTGLHDEYHTEKDVFATLSFGGMAKVVQTAALTLAAVDALPSRPTFSKDAVLGNLPGDRRAESTQRSIRVGMIPDMAAGGPGVRISGVSVKSPAERAGLKEGDRVIEFNGKKVDDLDTLQAAYLTAKPGDTVKVVFLRDGVRREQMVTVEGRSG